ncbi:hypothetical protein HMPREF0973_00053 [Prevotella veroralis F0319]|uniref:Uncharacterized protein n=1 Tax=Prevotella veroralis F0319 TaxID=649761 RepID=C9MKD4_9BACT|nr:hypothetical protein HMPREF0973_00053 [Prevotella veroralis F0319]
MTEEASPPNPSPNGTTPPSLPEGEECLTGVSQEIVSLIQRGRFLAMKRASLRCEGTPSLFANSSIYSPLHSERGWG